MALEKLEKLCLTGTCCGYDAFVFDGSMSRYEQLCAILKWLKNLAVKTDEIIEAIKELTEYVKNYFENLDLQDEVNKKLEQMERDGVFDELVSRLILKNTKINSVSDGTMQAIMECVTSYVRHNKDLAYITSSEGGNAWNYDTGVEQVTGAGGKVGMGIQCSAFCHLIMSGVPYEKSMYNLENGKVNHFGYAGYQYNIYGEKVTADNYTKYRFVRNMLPEFIKRGMAEPLNADYSNIQAGDLIFFDSNETPKPETATHMGIALSTPYTEYKENSEDAFILMAEALSQYNPIRVGHISSQRMKSRGAFYKVSIPWGSVPYQTGETIVNMGSVTASNLFTLGRELHIYEPVTVSFDFTPTSINSYAQIYVNGNSPTSGNILRTITRPLNAGDVGVTKHYSVPMSFYYSGADTVTNPVVETLRVYSNNPASGSHNGITNLSITRGWGSEPIKAFNTVSSLEELLTLQYKAIGAGIVNSHIWSTVCFDTDITVTPTTGSNNLTIIGWRAIDVEYFIFRTSNTMNVVARFFYNGNRVTMRKIGSNTTQITIQNY